MKNNLLIIYLKIFFFLIFSNPVNAEISIVIKVDDHIITNYDLDREINYLKILNPNLEKLDKKQIHKFAKKSLITEKIKEKEKSIIYYRDVKKWPITTKQLIKEKDLLVKKLIDLKDQQAKGANVDVSDLIRYKAYGKAFFRVLLLFISILITRRIFSF